MVFDEKLLALLLLGMFTLFIFTVILMIFIIMPKDIFLVLASIWSLHRFFIMDISNEIKIGIILFWIGIEGIKSLVKLNQKV